MRFQPGFSGRRRGPALAEYVHHNNTNTSSGTATHNGVPIGAPASDRETFVLASAYGTNFEDCRLNGNSLTPVSVRPASGSGGECPAIFHIPSGSGSPLAGVTEATLFFNTSGGNNPGTRVGYTIVRLTGGPRPLRVIDVNQVVSLRNDAFSPKLLVDKDGVALGMAVSTSHQSGNIQWTGLERISAFNVPTSFSTPNVHRHAGALLNSESEAYPALSATHSGRTALGSLISLGKNARPRTTIEYLTTIEQTSSGSSFEYNDVPFGAVPTGDEERYILALCHGRAGGSGRFFQSFSIADVAGTIGGGGPITSNGTTIQRILVGPAGVEAGTSGKVNIGFGGGSMTRFALHLFRLNRLLRLGQYTGAQAGDTRVFTGELHVPDKGVVVAGGYHRSTNPFIGLEGFDQVAQATIGGADRYFAAIRNIDRAGVDPRHPVAAEIESSASGPLFHASAWR